MGVEWCRVIVEEESLVDRRGVRVLLSAKETVEEVGDRAGAVLGGQAVDESTDDVLAGSEDHLGLDQSLYTVSGQHSISKRAHKHIPSESAPHMVDDR